MDRVRFCGTQHAPGLQPTTRSLVVLYSDDVVVLYSDCPDHPALHCIQYSVVVDLLQLHDIVQAAVICLYIKINSHHSRVTVFRKASMQKALHVVTSAIEHHSNASDMGRYQIVLQRERSLVTFISTCHGTHCSSEDRAAYNILENNPKEDRLLAKNDRTQIRRHN